MSLPYPFDTIINLPLSGVTYASRITENIDAGIQNNYFIIGFKAGFPLQASELNEIQEQQYVQNTLNNLCNNSWWNSTVNGGLTYAYSTTVGTHIPLSKDSTGGPFWNGATPLLSTDINVTFPSVSSGNVTVNSTTNWIYIRQVEGFGVWVTVPANSWTSSLSSIASPYSSVMYGGWWAWSSQVTSTMDTSLSDNQGGGAAGTNSTASADRLKISVYPDQSSTNPPTTRPAAVPSNATFYPVWKLVRRRYDLTANTTYVVESPSLYVWGYRNYA